MATITQAERPSFLSESECKAIARRLARFSAGGGLTMVTVYSDWTGNVRWARNQISTSGDVRATHVIVERNINGAQSGWGVTINDLSDRGLLAAVRRAERMARLRPETPQSDLLRTARVAETPRVSLFSETTYQLDEAQRAAAARTLSQSATDAGMLSAGYVEVGAHSVAQIDSDERSRYFQYTTAQYSVTVRDPLGTGSGWAGVDWHDWTKIDGAALSATALQKCLASRDPVRVEPGRYTVVLEPQAVCDFTAHLMSAVWTGGSPFDRLNNEYSTSITGPFAKDPPMGETPGTSRLGERVIDERITITSDPADPECGFPPFDPQRNPGDDRFSVTYSPVTWIERGRLAALEAPPGYAAGVDGRPERRWVLNQGAMHMRGGDTPIETMIATTTRGLLVTRFSMVEPMDYRSTLVRGYTRDGLWLIEQGRITKACKNLAFTESILAALNNVDTIGPSRRTFHPGGGYYQSMPSPVCVPSLKLRDFNFTSLTDAV